MPEERRRPALTREFVARVGIAWALVCGLLMAIHWSAIANARFPDPDDILRLVQVRDLIAGQSWFDVTQYRIDAPNGGVGMHWSRLVDIPLALLIIFLTPLVGAAAAETAALVLVPLFTLGAAMVLAARIAWRLIGTQEATLTCLIVALCVPALFQLAPMRIDHHGWQIVCALAAANGMMARSPKVGGRVIGVSLAIGLSISIEGLPFAAAIFALLAWRWWSERRDSAWLVHGIQAFALTGFVLFGLTRGVSDLAAYCDAMNPVYLGAFAFGAIAITILGRFSPTSRLILLSAFAVIGAGAIAIVLTSAPHCSSGGFSELDPLVKENWHALVKEGMPIWHQTPLTAFQYAITPLLGVYAAYGLRRSNQGGLKHLWGDYALILLAAFAVSIFVARAGAVACVLAAPPLAWQIRIWLRKARAVSNSAIRIMALVAIAIALLPALPIMVVSSIFPSQGQIAGAEVAASDKQPNRRVSACRVSDIAEQLEQLPAGEFYAPLDLAPDLLLSTGHTVVATGHHRGDGAMKVLIETALGSSQAARETLGARGTRYVIVCPHLSEVRNYARLAPDGFVADLITGRGLSWLEPVPIDSASGLKAWRLTPGRNPSPGR